MWVVAGSFHEAGPDEPHTYNTSLVFDRDRRAGRDLPQDPPVRHRDPGRVTYQESATVAPGRPTPVTVDVEGVRVGLSICYDLRFPELYRQLAVAGARVLLVPAAFTTHTGRDHWEVLLRARAIENQCYVVAAGQTATTSPGTSCFGRSMIIDPWGTVVAQAPDGVGLLAADLDLGGRSASGACPAWPTAGWSESRQGRFAAEPALLRSLTSGAPG